MHEQHDIQNRSAGFTLVEILLALAVGAVLLTSMSSGLQLFGEELEYARDEPDTRLEEVTLLVADRVRDAWWVEAASATELRIAEPSGNLTTFALAGDELRVTRPSGAQGVLLDGVASVGFGVDTIERLRDDAPTTVDGPWFDRPEPAGPPVEIVLGPGDALALGFHMSDDAPDSVNVVTGVDEERLDAAVDSIDLAFAFLDKNKKEFCHEHAVQPHNPEHPGYTGLKMIAELYEARAPDDARPHGPLLGTVEIPAVDLPPTTYVWWDTSINQEAFPPDAEDASGGPKDCEDLDGDGICDHPGNSKHSNPIDPPNGVAWGWWNNHPDVVLIADPVTATVTVDLSQFGLAIEPGRAYSVVIRVDADGWDELRFRAVPTGAADGSGVAFQTAGGNFVSMPLGIGVSLAGVQTCTQTVSEDVISRVTLDLVMADGRQLSSSGVVQGQVAVADPWRGVVTNQVGDVGP